MAAVNNVPQLVVKKGGSYAAIAPKLEPGKSNKWKKYDIMESVVSCETTKATLANLVHSSKSSSDTKENKIMDLKAEYKKIKAKLVLLEGNPSTSHTLKTLQPKNKGLVAETFDWDKEEVSNDEEVTQVKVLMALADDELTVGKDYTRNGEWIDITMR
ncbi:hypothetical protein Tco_1303243 [Tanacetum coccineum]